MVNDYYTSYILPRLYMSFFKIKIKLNFKIIIYISNFKCFVTKCKYLFIKIVNTYYTKI